MLRFIKISIPLILVTAFLPVSASSSSARKYLQQPLLSKVVNVNISFNTQTPITDFSEQTVSALQNAARSMFYRSTLKECAALKEIIATTCTLKSLNMSSRLNQQHNGTTSLYINGSAQFSITLKNEIPQ